MIDSINRGPALDHERVVSARGSRSGLAITVAVHSTVLGPALGGCRVWTYDAGLDALHDALRLATAMTLKNAAAGLDAGGGKAVIRLAPGERLDADRREAALLDLGDQVESLGGSYRTAEDVGTTADDMDVVARRTAHVVGRPPESGGSGEPADATAAGVYAGIEATLRELDGHADVADRTFVVSGLGQVGTRLATQLRAAGATVVASDVDERRRAVAESIGARWVEPEAALVEPADVLVPAGVGGLLTSGVIEALRVRAVVGPANNPLAERSGAEALRARGILYAPDFVVNAGGVIHLALAAEGASESTIAARVAGIGATLARVYAEARSRDSSPLPAAEALAFARLHSDPEVPS